MERPKPRKMEREFYSCAQSNSDELSSKKTASNSRLEMLVSKISHDEDPSIRLSAIRTLIEIYTKGCTHESDDRINDIAISSLREFILEKNNRTEHNESLRLICAISLGRFSDFSKQAKMIIGDILPTIGLLENDYAASRLFAIACLASNSINDKETSLFVYKSLIDAFIGATTKTVPRKEKNKAMKSQVINDNHEITHTENETNAEKNSQIEGQINDSVDSKNDNQQKSTENDRSYRRSRNRGSSNCFHELIGALILISSSLPSEAAVEYIDDITLILSICLGSSISQNDQNAPIDYEMASDGLDLFLVIHECLEERQEELHISSDIDLYSPSEFDEKDIRLSIRSKEFVDHFRPNIENLAQRLARTQSGGGSTKQKIKALQQKTAKILRYIDDNTKPTLDLSFGQQHVSIIGARNIAIADSVKKITQKNFLDHLKSNVALQNELGFSLVSEKSATRLKKVYSEEIKQDRCLSKKDREKDRMKKRNQKERLEMEDF